MMRSYVSQMRSSMALRRSSKVMNGISASRWVYSVRWRRVCRAKRIRNLDWKTDA
jgi:hypothetical protein